MIQPIAPIIHIARQAAEAMMLQLVPDIEVFIKPDGTPYTKADIDAHNVVTSGLAALDATIPIMSEEGFAAEQQAALQSSCRWVTDPLDGSKTSIKYARGEKDKNGFGVHIALMDNNIPTLGVIYYPAKGNGGLLYYTGDDGYAYRQEGNKAPRRIHASTPPLGEFLKAAVSWREKERPADIGGRPIQHIPEVGGGRVCITAEGVTDLACIDRPFSHWDLAASHAVLRAAGGELVGVDTKRPVTYDDLSLAIPPCIGASTDTLTLLGLGKDFPKQSRTL